MIFRLVSFRITITLIIKELQTKAQKALNYHSPNHLNTIVQTNSKVYKTFETSQRFHEPRLDYIDNWVIPDYYFALDQTRLDWCLAAVHLRKP